MLSRIVAVSAAGGHATTMIEIGRDQVPPCVGCLTCITQHPGFCISDDAIRPLAEEAAQCAFVVFLCASSFGNPSSAMKNVIDRGRLVVRNSHSRQIVIGYGETASDEEARTFIDIVERHRGAAEIVHPKLRETIEAHFTRGVEDNVRIAALLALV